MWPLNGARRSQHADAVQVLAALRQTDPAMASLVAMVDPACRGRVWNAVAVEASAHHAIVPTAAAGDIGKLSPDERAIYDLIRRRYLAQFFPAYEYDETLVEAAVAGETFRASGRVERVAGWRAVLAPAAVATPAARGRATARPGGDTGDADEDGSAEAQQALPAMRAGEPCRAEAAEVRACQTQPPAHFTEGTLIAAMKSAAKYVTDARLRAVLKETAGIGTEATRASIIKTLFDRGFVEKHGKKHLISTAAGRMLIDALPAAVCDPAMTALWEQALDEIAQGRGTLDAFMAAVAPHVDQCTDTFGQFEPRKGEGPTQPGEQHHDKAQPAADKAQSTQHQRAEAGSQHSTGVCTGQIGLETVKPRPFKRATGTQHQQQAQHRQRDGGANANRASGGHTLNLSPGLGYALTPDSQLYGLIQFALKQYVHADPAEPGSGQLTAPWSFTLGLTHRF